ncbi:MAG: DUF47 family protein [Candidatus Limnocylindrales bacterium]
MPIRWPTAHWFLPEDPAVLERLNEQVSITVAGMEAFAAWAAGDVDAGDRVREKEHEADEAKLAVRIALRDAFITPVSPEDVFTLSQSIDRLLNDAKDVVREAEVMDMAPDEPMAEMAGLVLEGMKHLMRACEAITPHGGDNFRSATSAADDATKSARRMEKVYRRAMSDLLDPPVEEVGGHEHVREVTGRRELYRRLSRIASTIADVADRVWYAAVKEM